MNANKPLCARAPSCCHLLKVFTQDGTNEPEGHRNDDPELNAPVGATSAEEAEVTTPDH